MRGLTQAEWEGRGYNSWVAEALEGRGIFVEDAAHMSSREILDEVFTWHGLIGFTSSIVEAVDNVRNVETL